MNDHDATRLARGGRAPDFETPPSAPPLYLTTAFDIDDLSQLDAVVAGTTSGYLYTRDGNPNHTALSADLAALEGAEAAAVFASGMGALTATLVAAASAGDHILAGQVLYGRSGQLLKLFAKQYQVDVTFFDPARPGELAGLVTPRTKLCLVESLTNPLLEVADLPAIRQAIGDIPLLVDATFATPILQKPLELGATLVWHSGSKALNGHGDVMLGSVAGPSTWIRKIRGLSSLLGVNANPFECWLASRGLRTLALRMERVTATANRFAKWLSTQPGVERVYHPSLPEHPTHELAQRMLPRGSGGMLAFDLAGGRPAVDRFFRAISEAVPFSPTLADARTTLSYPAGTSHKFMTADERASYGIGEGLVRVSIGLEDPADLERDFAAALEVAVN